MNRAAAGMGARVAGDRRERRRIAHRPRTARPQERRPQLHDGLVEEAHAVGTPGGELTAVRIHGDDTVPRDTVPDDTVPDDTAATAPVQDLPPSQRDLQVFEFDYWCRLQCVRFASLLLSDRHPAQALDHVRPLLTAHGLERQLLPAAPLFELGRAHLRRRSLPLHRRTCVVDAAEPGRLAIRMMPSWSSALQAGLLQR